MSRIYELIGKIVESAQYLEHNMSLMIYYNEILKEFKERKEIPLNEYDKIKERALKLQEDLGHETMGHIIKKVEEVKMFTSEDIRCLINVLKGRNDIVHRYFRKNDFNENNWNDKKFIKRHENKLISIYEETLRVNNAICKVIEMQKEEYNSIS